MSGVCPSVRVSVCLSGSHFFFVVSHSYVTKATHAFLGMLQLCSICYSFTFHVKQLYERKCYPVNGIIIIRKTITRYLHYSNGFIAGKNAHILNGINCIEFVLNTSVFVIMNIQLEVFQKFT